MLIPQPLPCPLMPTPPPPFQCTEAGLAVTVKSRVSIQSWDRSAVMVRPETLCIATVTVLVILAAAVEPGEHYLTATICTVQVCGNVCIQSVVTPQKSFLHFLRYMFKFIRSQ